MMNWKVSLDSADIEYMKRLNQQNSLVFIHIIQGFVG